MANVVEIEVHGQNQTGPAFRSATRGVDRLVRDANGRLRDARGRFVKEGEAAGQGFGDGVRDGAERGLAGLGDSVSRILSGLKGIAIAAGADLASSIAGPLVAAAGATTAAFASAGAAVGAFGLAAAGQVGDLSSAAEAHTALQEAIATHGPKSEEAKAALDAYQQSLEGMPPATQDAAYALVDLKNTYNEWSDALAGDTMPVFTRALNAAKAALPALTPLVKAGAGALGDFMGQLQKDAQSQGFRRFTSQLADASRSVLPSLLNSVRNLAIGFGGLISAFLPMADDMSGGLEDLTEKFADWGRSLESNQGFQDFLADVSDQGPEIIDLLGDLAQIVGNVAEAMAPFTGVTLKVTAALADFVAAIPQDVMDWLAPTITGIVLAIKAWTVVQGVLNVLLAANPIGLVVLAIAGLAAGLIYAYKNSETFREIVDKAFSVVKEKGLELWEKIKPGLEKMGQLLGESLPEAATFLAESLDDLAADAQNIAEKVLGINAGLSETPEGEGLKGWMEDVKETFVQGHRNILDMWSSTWEGLNRKVVSGGKRLAGSVHEGIGNSVRELLSPWPGAQARFSRFWSGLASRARSGANRIMGAASGLTRRIGGLRPSWSGLWRGLSSAGARVTGMLRSILARAQSLASRIGGAVRGAIPFMATGGISHAAEGGPRGNLTLVGEQGPELVRLPQGAQVWPHGTSMGMLNRMGGGGGASRLVWGGGPTDELGAAIWEWLKANVRLEGGGGDDSVQKALT